MSQVTIGVASLLLFSSFQSVKKIACFWRRSLNLWDIYMHFFLFIFTENESYSWFQIRNFLCVLETFCVLPFLPFLMSKMKIVNRILCINRTIHRSAAIHITHRHTHSAINRFVLSSIHPLLYVWYWCGGDGGVDGAVACRKGKIVYFFLVAVLSFCCSQTLIYFIDANHFFLRVQYKNKIKSSFGFVEHKHWKIVVPSGKTRQTGEKEGSAGKKRE